MKSVIFHLQIFWVIFNSDTNDNYITVFYGFFFCFSHKFPHALSLLLYIFVLFLLGCSPDVFKHPALMKTRQKAPFYSDGTGKSVEINSATI